MHDFLFGKNKADYDTEYAKAIDSTKQAKADAEYNYHYNKALYDANKDYFDKIGVKDPTESYWNASGQKVNALTDSMSQYDKYLSQLSDERAKVAEKNKYNDFGDGFLPSLFGLNAWNQYLDTVGDFGKVLQQAGKNVMSGDYSVDPTAEWEKRDHLSDLGATIESGISILPFVSAGAGSGASAANAATKTLGKSLLKGAGIGAAYGGAGSLGSYLQQNGKESNLGGALGSSALGASIGGAMGGAFGGLGYGLDKLKNGLANVAMNKRAVWEDVPYQLYDDMGNPMAKNGVSYQDALKKAGLDMTPGSAGYKDTHLLGRIMSGAEIDTKDLTPEVMDRLTGKLNRFTESLGGKKAPNVTVVGNEIYSPKQQLQQALNRVKTIPNAEGSTRIATSFPGLATSARGRALQGAGDVIGNIAKGVGNTVPKLLKTKTGKIGAGIGGGLLLSKLMNSGNSNSNQISDAELQELYNYIYRGGQ